MMKLFRTKTRVDLWRYSNLHQNCQGRDEGKRKRHAKGKAEIMIQIWVYRSFHFWMHFHRIITHKSSSGGVGAGVDCWVTIWRHSHIPSNSIPPYFSFHFVEKTWPSLTGNLESTIQLVQKRIGMAEFTKLFSRTPLNQIGVRRGKWWRNWKLSQISPSLNCKF